MKKTLLIFAIAALLGSCKKKTTEPTSPITSQVINNYKMNFFFMGSFSSNGSVKMYINQVNKDLPSVSDTFNIHTNDVIRVEMINVDTFKYGVILNGVVTYSAAGAGNSNLSYTIN